MQYHTYNDDKLNNLKSRDNSSLKYSPSTTSLLSRTRKISNELPRPLKRSTSLTYRIFSPSQMTVPNIMTKTAMTRSSSIKNIKKRLKCSLSRSSSTNRFKSSNSTKSLSTMLAKNDFNADNIISPPSSPTFSNTNTDLNDDNDDNDDNASNTSIFSSSSNSGLISRDTSYNFSTFTKSNISSYESSPIKENSAIKCQPILNDFLNSNIFLNEFENDDVFMFDQNTDNDILTINSTFNFQSLKSPHPIFEIPEILEIILRYISLDDNINRSSEPKMLRRPPLSYNHSLLMYGKEDGEEIWNKTIASKNLPANTTDSSNSNLFNCLLVSKQWYFLIKQILHENLNFKNDEQLSNFSNKIKSNPNNIFKSEPFSIVFNKLKSTQSKIEDFSQSIDSRRLNLIEFYICPTLLPPLSLITESLNQLILPGCKKLTDNYLKLIISKTPNLKGLDIRACELITDASLYFLSKKCPKLEILNCGRHRRGEFITDISIGLIVKNCPIKTIGLAGCGISDWSIWEIAINCGLNLERLSINNCWKLTDLGICKVLKAELIENLKVLEIRNLNLQNLNEIVKFKKRCNFNNFKILIEGCERIDNLLIQTENKINLKLREKLLSDLNQWVNNCDDLRDDELAYVRFLNDKSRNNLNNV